MVSFLFLKRWYTQVQRGYSTLLTIFVVGAVGLSITVGSLLLGIGVTRTSFAHEQAAQAQALAHACAEEALQKIHEVALFTGSGVLALPTGNCSYTVTSQGGENRTITSTGTVSTIQKKMRVFLNDITPIITITSWQDVSDY